jgi:hypothetical protein
MVIFYKYWPAKFDVLKMYIKELLSVVSIVSLWNVFKKFKVSNDVQSNKINRVTSTTVSVS